MQKDLECIWNDFEPDVWVNSEFGQIDYILVTLDFAQVKTIESSEHCEG